MLLLVFKNLGRRPLRNLVTIGGLGLALASLLCLLGFSRAYQASLRTETDRMGMQMMLVPLGCPYDAAARVLKAEVLENSLPEAVLGRLRSDPAVAVAAPLLTAAVDRPKEKRVDLWVGLDESALALKPWWKAHSGSAWFQQERSVILGADAAALEMRVPGDKFFEPKSGMTLEVAGVLERSGTSDDNVFFVPLATAQRMFGQVGRLSAVAVRLRDPAAIREASRRWQDIPGAQVVTLTEMMGSFLNLIGAARGITLAIGAVAAFAGGLMVFNTLLAAVLHRGRELSLMRAVGASRRQIFFLIEGESILFGLLASAAGVILAPVGGHFLLPLLGHLLPLAPAHSLPIDGLLLVQTVGAGLAIGAVAGLYPALHGGRLAPADAVKM